MPQHSRRLFTFNMYKGTDAYSLRVRYLTGAGTIHKQDTVPIAVSPIDVDMSTNPPSLAKNLEGFFQEQINEHIPKRAKSEEERARHTRAIHIALYIASQLHDRYFDSATAVKMRVQAYFNSLIPGRKITYGLFHGKAFLQHKLAKTPSMRPQTRLVWPKDLVTLLPAAPEAEASLLPDVCIFSRYYARIAPVTDTATNTYVAGKGLVEAIENIYEAADIVNTEIDQHQPPTDTCSCDEEHSKSTIHLCNFRGCQTLCNKLQYLEVTQSRICPPCTDFVATETQQMAQKFIKSMAERAIRADFEAMNMDASDRQAVTQVVEQLLQNLQSVLKQHDDDLVASDKYVPDAVRSTGAGSAQQEVSAEDHETSRPFRMSLDAVFQKAMDATGRLSLHVPGNVVVTAMWLNFAKHTWTPAWLQILSRLSKCSSPEERAELLRLEEDVFAVSLETSYRKAARLGQMTTAEDFALAEYERIAGKPLSVSADVEKLKKMIISTRWGTIPAAPRKGWVPGKEGEFADRIWPMIQEIIDAWKKKTGIEPAYGTDGCPFPSEEGDMPPDWSWWTAWVFVATRLQRMWL